MPTTPTALLLWHIKEWRRCRRMYGRGDVVTRQQAGLCKEMAALLIGESL